MEWTIPLEANRARRFDGCGAARCAGDRPLSRAGLALAAKPTEAGPGESAGPREGRPSKRRAQAAGARFWSAEALFARPKRAFARVRAGKARGHWIGGPFWVSGGQLNFPRTAM
jgi:hypothetical protein